LHRDINGAAPRGPFDIRVRLFNEVATYPALWAHDAPREKTMVFEEDCVADVRSGADPEKMQRISHSASHLHFNQDWRFNSQSLNAQWTPRPAIGGRAWPSIQLRTDVVQETLAQHEVALLLWLNTSVGSAVRWLWSNRQQTGRGVMTREVIKTLPVLDITTLTQDQLSACEVVFHRLQNQSMRPLHELDRDTVRHELDRALLAEILGWPLSWFQPHGPVDIFRRKLAAEPSIHGHHGRSTRG